MENSVLLPVILAGGSGERLWPLSRHAYPKQFLTLLGAKISLFQETLQRLPQNNQCLPPVIVCHEEHRFLVAEQLRKIDITPSAIILEPIANNTAPAIALASLWAKNEHPNATMLVLPADHFMPDPSELLSKIETLLSSGPTQSITTFGLKVTHPATGYGYIEVGSKVSKNIHKVKQFIEKPNLATAQKFVNDRYLWNSGMFALTPDFYLQQLESHQPDILQSATKAMMMATTDLDFIRPDPDAYKESPSISIDYAIMEKTSNACVIPISCEWSDVGSFQAIWEHSDKDENNNAINGDAYIHNTRGCLIESRHRVIATADVEDLAIIETSDAILVSKRDNSESLKKLVAQLKSDNCNVATENRHVVRPWGYFDSIIKGERFQVKILVVEPGKKLSLQMHHHRSEHWIVVKGTAKVIRDETEYTLSENESTFIPIGIKHQLINDGKIALEVIEVQSGSYLGEDDIIRFEEEVAYA